MNSVHGRIYVGARGGTCPPDPLVPPPQIKKLADCSDVILGVPKCSKIEFFGAPPRTTLRELTALPRLPS